MTQVTQLLQIVTAQNFQFWKSFLKNLKRIYKRTYLNLVKILPWQLLDLISTHNPFKNYKRAILCFLSGIQAWEVRQFKSDFSVKQFH
jgi:hypothetical protein